MAELNTNEKPCKVQTERGFSVIYKNRPLYSKYNPEKPIIQAVESLNISSGTLILIFSPVLWHGISNLLEKLPDNSFIIACEKDAELFDLAKQELENLSKSDKKLAKAQDNKILSFLTPEKSENLVQILNSILSGGSIKKIVRLDFSAGVQFAQNFYDELFTDCQQVVSQFWKNRLTLLKFGRLYSANLFQNLARSAHKNTISFEKLKNTVSKPILVCGTGESLEKTAALVKNRSIAENFYILAVDASLPVLKAYGIIPDGVIGVESQLAIEKSYIGINSNKSQALYNQKALKPFTFFADITSRPHVADITSKDGATLCYFTSLFDNNVFLNRLKQSGILPQIIPPLGSVGLAAVHIALLLRMSEDIKVFVTGLDFSYTTGRTHARSSASHLNFLQNIFRLASFGNYEASFGSTAINATKSGSRFTTANLADYAKSFKLWFSNTKNLFKLGEEGFCLGIPELKHEDLCNTQGKINSHISKDFASTSCNSSKITAFLRSEIESLRELKELLVTGGNLSKDQLDSKIAGLLEGRNYLYLHFPDGTQAKTDLSFLKRVRSEIDFFIKTITIALKQIGA